jgi:hypothetical protein
LYDPPGEPILDSPDPHSIVPGNAGLVGSE